VATPVGDFDLPLLTTHADPGPEIGVEHSVPLRVTLN
jgi:hypothetical protein